MDNKIDDAKKVLQSITTSEQTCMKKKKKMRDLKLYF